jgi:hypothetical protein
VHGPADGLAEDGPNGPCDVFFSFFLFSFILFDLASLDYISIFFYFYILVRRRLALRLTA